MQAQMTVEHVEMTTMLVVALRSTNAPNTTVRNHAALQSELDLHYGTVKLHRELTQDFFERARKWYCGLMTCTWQASGLV